MEKMDRQQGNIHGRESFIRHISGRLGRPQPLREAPERPVLGVPDHYAAVRATREEQIGLFMSNWTALSGNVKVVDSAQATETVGDYVRAVCAERNVTRAAMWDHPGLQALNLEHRLRDSGVEVVNWTSPPADAASAQRSSLLQTVERCAMGIVWADYAVANTGTIALITRAGRGRSVSLLPDILLAVFHERQLVTRMGEALTRIRSDFPATEHFPSSFHLITGPSRSADIENDLTIGVHGPGQVFAVIVRE